MEWINEKKERKERRNNIIIKGVKWGKKRLEQKVEEFIKDSGVVFNKSGGDGKKDDKNKSG